jgi:hypothetical protein
MQEKLEEVCMNSIFSVPTQEERRLMRRISELLAREETITKQHSHVLYMSS